MLHVWAQGKCVTVTALKAVRSQGVDNIEFYPHDAQCNIYIQQTLIGHLNY